ncbi:MAG: hypothetical protein QM704_22685 [Anaeromyxobacteraceae bacterium]
MENGHGEKAGGGLPGDVGARVGEVGRRMEERLEDVRGWADEAGENLRAFVREQPGIAIGVAAGLGFVLGRIFSKT